MEMAVKKKVDKPAEIPQISVKKVPVAVVEKMQAIAGIEGATLSELYVLAFTKFIELYEGKNGKVKVNPKGKGLEGL